MKSFQVLQVSQKSYEVTTLGATDESRQLEARFAERFEDSRKNVIVILDYEAWATGYQLLKQYNPGMVDVNSTAPISYETEVIHLIGQPTEEMLERYQEVRLGTYQGYNGVPLLQSEWDNGIEKKLGEIGRVMSEGQNEILKNIVSV